MDTRDRMKLEGTVVSANKDIFMVETTTGQSVKCKLSGKIRVNQVRILVNDSVEIEVSPMDTTQGRIVYRVK